MAKQEHKIKKNGTYYLVLHKRDWTYKPAVIVPVKVVKRKSLNWVIVEQTIGEFKHRLTVHNDWLAPYDIEKAKNLLHNMKMWEERRYANSWRSRLNYKTAKIEVPKALAELPKNKQCELLKKCKAVYPAWLNADGSFNARKMQMKNWDEVAWAIIALKYPLKEVW